MIKYILGVCVSLSTITSVYAANYGFSVQNDISSHNSISYYIHLGPNGGSNDITMASNPDQDNWFLDGAFASHGNQANYQVTSPDNFSAQPDQVSTNCYSNFNYDSSANTVIYIYDNQNDLITTCDVSIYYDKGHHNHAIIKNDVEPCQNSNYYVEDDQHGLNYATLFVHHGKFPTQVCNGPVLQ